MGKKKKQKQTKGAVLPEEDSLTKTLRWLIWAGLFFTLLVPLMVRLGAFFPFISYRTIWFMGCVQFTTAIWAYLAYYNKEYRPKLSPVLIVVGLFMAVLALSAALGADPFHSFWSKHERMTGVLVHLHLFAFFVVLFSFLKSETAWKSFLSIAVGVACVVGLWGIADIVGLNFVLQLYDLFGIAAIELTDLARGGSTLGNRSFWGSYMLINAFFALYLVFKSEKPWRYVAGAAFVLIVMGLFFNESGNAMKASFVIGIFLFALIYFSFYYKNRIVNYAGRGLLALSLVGAIYIGISTFQEGSVAREQIMDLPGIRGRVRNWEAVWDGVMERPVLGWGQENFEIALYENYDPRVMLGGDYGYREEPWHDRAHNVVIDYLVATGFLGTFLFFGMFAAALLVLWKAYLIDKRIDFWAPGVFTALVVAHFIQNLTVFDMISSYMLMFVVLAFGAAISGETIKPGSAKEEDTAEKKGKGAKKAASAGKKSAASPASIAIALGLAILLGVCFNYFCYQPHQGSLNTSLALRDQPGVPKEELYEEAIYTSPLGRRHIRRHLAEDAMSRLNQAEEAEEFKIYSEDLEFMAAEVEKSTIETPLNFRHYYTLGQIYNTYARSLMEATGDEETRDQAEEKAEIAKDTFKKAHEISPTNLQAHWNLAQAKIYLGSLRGDESYFEEALSLCKEAAGIEPRLFDSHRMAVSIAAQLLNDEELAVKLAEEALEVRTDWEEDLEQIVGEL